MTTCSGNKPVKANTSIKKCEMFKQYTKCSDCPEFPNGYPDGITLQICCGGKSYFIVSNQDNNNYDPCDYIGNTDDSKPWLVMSAMDYWQYLIDQSIGDFLTEPQVIALINGIFGAVITGGRLDCAKLIEHCGLATAQQVLSIQQVLDGKQGQLKNCAGANHVLGASVPSCAEMAAAIKSAIEGIPEPESVVDCGGKAVPNNKVVACANLGSDFKVDADTGAVSISTKDICIETNTTGSSCGVIKQLWTITDPTTGCAKLVSPDSINLTIAGITPDHPAIDATGSAVLPTDPTDTSTFYSIGDLRSDHANGAVDQDLLDAWKLSCVEVPFDCDGDYDFNLAANPILDWDLQGEGAFVISVGGVLMENSPGVLKIFPRLTSTSGTYQETLSYLVDAGDQEVCTYYIGGNDSSAPIAQMLFSAQQPRLVIEKKVTSA